MTKDDNKPLGRKLTKMQQRAIIQDNPQLPFWQECHRAIPNDIARSALFTIRNKRAPRVAMQRDNIYHLHRDVTISYTGVELRASDDELVWLQVISYSKMVELGNEFSFSLYQLCNDLGWPTTGHYYKKLEQCLERLRAGVLWVEKKDLGVFDVPVIAEYRRDYTNAKRSLCTVRIDQRTMLLFFGENWARIAWDQYRQLSDISRRLYDYIVTHRDPHPLPIEKLHKLCASDCKCPREWRRMVRKACKELEDRALVDAILIADQKIMIYRKNRKLASE